MNTNYQRDQSHPPVSLLSWNIQVGSETPLIGNNWAKRKVALSQILLLENPDIFCVQEALLGQLQFIDEVLAGHKRVGVGRDDGKEKGEHCAIFYRSARFTAKESDTFWLSDTPHNSQQTWDLFFKRICTWAHFSDQFTGKEFLTFNTHFPLNPLAQTKAAALVIDKMRKNCQGERVLLTGDFNCTPNGPSWKLIKKSGFKNAEQVANATGQLSDTCHFLGHAVGCIDAVFTSIEIKVLKHRILTRSNRAVWPSDHFGTAIEFKIE
jgi:endonuclease/exonuclease/phosphatase family metal-dependent hydrolase